MHRHWHIVQTSCEKDSNGKHTKDRTILIMSFSQYEWTDSVTDVPNKIIIKYIITPFIVTWNTHITDVLIKEVLPFKKKKKKRSLGRFSFTNY